MKILNRWLCDPSRLGLWIILITLACASAPVLAVDSGPATTEPPASENDSGGILERVQASMTYLLKLNPRHLVNRDPNYRSELAQNIVDAGQGVGEDPLLLVTIMYCESTLRPSAVGALGEVGLGQVHGEAARGCELTTAAGQAACSAKWLAYCRSLCDGSDSQALTRYATGSSCHAEKGGKVDRLVAYRLKIYRDITKSN